MYGEAFFSATVSISKQCLLPCKISQALYPETLKFNLFYILFVKELCVLRYKLPVKLAVKYLSKLECIFQNFLPILI